MTEAQIAALVVLVFLAWIAWEIGKRTSPSRNLRKIQRIAELARKEREGRQQSRLAQQSIPIIGTQTSLTKPAPANVIAAQTHREESARDIHSLLGNCRMFVLDGSNIMHWQSETPELKGVKEVIRHLKEYGSPIHVVFDASYRHQISRKDMTRSELAALLEVGENSITIAPAGVVADELILRLAEDNEAAIISNDRYLQYPKSQSISRYSGNISVGKVYLYVTHRQPQ